MKYFLDTNIIITLLNDRSIRLKSMVTSHSPKNIKIPSMVKAELLVGAHKKPDIDLQLEKIRKILLPFEIVTFDDDATQIYGKIRAGLEMKGNAIGPGDMIIAATVLSRGGVLVTNNTREFSRVEGLHIEDWL